MIRKFNINNNQKGRVMFQMEQLVLENAIQFEKGAKRNTCIMIVDEDMVREIDSRDMGISSVVNSLKYLYSLVNENREIVG